MEPAYSRLARSGALADRVAEAVRRLERCVICPIACGANRLHDEIGDCGVGRLAAVASAGPHLGEEPPLVGRRGSGTIFFGGCNLRCVFCQNSDLSHGRSGTPLEPAELAETMVRLQERGCHNINLVSPSHVVPQFLEALQLAIDRGLELPIVYNTGGYDSLATLRLLDGIVDIYMPDAKYADEQVAAEFSGVRHYVRVNRKAMRAMHRQVGDLTLDDRGIALRGMLIRHLVLPLGLAGTAEVVRFIAHQLSPDSYVNVMDQYHPSYRAHRDQRLARRIRPAEFEEALRLARDAGLHRGFDDPDSWPRRHRS